MGFFSKTGTNLKGSGALYVLLILGLVSGFSYLLTGGLTPNIERKPENPEFVEIEDPLTPAAQQNLQMQNIGIKPTDTPTPFPTQQASSCPNNLVVNGSFEVDTVGMSPPTGWTNSGTVTSATNYLIPDGSKYAALTGNQTLQQRITVTPGAGYSLSFYSASHSPGSQTVTVQYFTGNNVATGSTESHTITHDINSNNAFGGPYLLTIPPAPLNSSYLLVTVKDNNVDFAKVDYFCLQQTSSPTPTSSPTSIPSATPTRTPTPSPTRTPTPTPTVTACLDRTAIALLVDLSYSMNVPSSKLSALNSALNLLNSRLTNDTVVGAYAFGPYPDYNGGGDTSFNFENNGGVKQILPFKKYSENKSQIDSRLGGMSQGGVGGTYMRNGFTVMYNKIRAAKQTYPGYNFVTILLSDGVPELGDDDPVVQDYWNRGLGFPVVACFGNKCFAKHQDPRAWSDIGTSNRITPLRNESKNGIIYTIAIYGTEWPDTSFKPYLEDLLQDVAGGSSSPRYQAINDTNFSRLSTFYTNILNSTCP